MPANRIAEALLRNAGFHTAIVGLNIETVEALRQQGHSAVFGDAWRAEVLKQAGIKQAVHLIVTLPCSAGREKWVLAAKQLNPSATEKAEEMNVAEKFALKVAGTSAAIYEVGEAGITLAEQVMERRGRDETAVRWMLESLQMIWGMKSRPEVEMSSPDDANRKPECQSSVASGRLEAPQTNSTAEG